MHTTDPAALPPPLLIALVRLTALQREAVDRLALQEAVAAAAADNSPQEALATVARHLQVKPARWRERPDAADLPALIAAPDGRWGILRARNATGQWISEWFDPTTKQWREEAHDALPEHRLATLKLLPPYRASQSPVLRLTVDEVLAHKGLLLEAAVGGLLLACLALLTSFYTMQVYDRVIPTGATQTLLVLTLGILLVIGLEYFARRVRSHLYDRLIDQVDQRLARTVYLRFLGIRLDQLPASVGSLAGQLRGYESVRGFLVSLTTHLAVDVPFALIFLLVIAAIGGALALIPLAFFAVALMVGLWQAGRMRQLAERNQAAANRQTGLLVESVEAAEIIKSGQGGWRMLGRWLASTDEARAQSLEMRHLNEGNQYRAQALQQGSYVLLIATGAWLASQGQLTLGGLIACSILSGRVLGPVVQISTLLSAWANVKAALKGLDALWRLEDDHHGQEQPVHLEQVQGHYRFENVTMALRGKPALKVGQLQIAAGQKIGVLGPVGAGKTTLLRLLSGMYKPNEGRIWLDDVDLAHLSTEFVREHVGYLPQDVRLFQGTLRENLTIGLPTPSDSVIMHAAALTGLDAAIRNHPKGLELEIAEGGSGLSGGQRQLVNLTRVFLRQPRLWLLDEPSASLDRNLELQLIQALKQTLKPDDTLVLVTHKPEMLQLVERVIVIANQQVIMDGPRDAVLARLQAGPNAQTAGNSPQNHLHAVQGGAA